MPRSFAKVWHGQAHRSSARGPDFGSYPTGSLTKCCIVTCRPKCNSRDLRSAEEQPRAVGVVIQLGHLSEPRYSVLLRITVPDRPVPRSTSSGCTALTDSPLTLDDAQFTTGAEQVLGIQLPTCTPPTDLQSCKSIICMPIIIPNSIRCNTGTMQYPAPSAYSPSLQLKALEMHDSDTVHLKAKPKSLAALYNVFICCSN